MRTSAAVGSYVAAYANLRATIIAVLPILQQLNGSPTLLGWWEAEVDPHGVARSLLPILR